MTTVDDMFDDAPAAPVQKYPTIKQLGSGDVKVSVTYAKGEDSEQTKDTTGRLCIFRPVGIKHGIPNRFDSTKPPGDQMQVDVILLTGPPLTEVIDKDGEATATIDPPKKPGDVLPAMYISQTVLIGQFKQMLSAAEKSTGRMTVGRLVLLTPNPGSTNKPWAVGVAADPKQKAADLALAKAWVKANPEPDPFA